MALIGSDGLSLSLGDGGETEVFNALVGARVVKFEVSQKNHEATAVNNVWQASQGLSNRKALFDVEALSDDGAAALRARTLAFNGLTGNFQLMLGSQLLSGAGVVTSYQEVTQAGAIKQLRFRMESSGVLTIA